MTADQSFTEVADRVWVARHTWFDLNVTLVGGDTGLLMVDTHASAPAAAAMVEEVRRLGRGEVTAVVNTHEHFDHTFGNATVLAAYGAIPVTAHEEAAAATVSAGERVKALYRAQTGPDADPHAADPHAAEVIGTEIVPAGTTFSSAVVLDLGDRQVELVHPGRGHTAGDLVVRVPDADLVVAGDLVEESPERSQMPGMGADCYPLEWPLTLDIVLSLTTSSSLVVPGHGALVDRDFVELQRNTLGIVAETIRDLAARGVPVSQALETGEWPWPREQLADAVARAYAQLPRSQKRLPLI